MSGYGEGPSDIDVWTSLLLVSYCNYSTHNTQIPCLRPCLHTWLDTRPNRQLCPVCKSAISREKVIPLYGRGCNDKTDPRDKIPPRPRGQRTEESNSVGILNTQTVSWCRRSNGIHIGIPRLPLGRREHPGSAAQSGYWNVPTRPLRHLPRIREQRPKGRGDPGQLR